jgi:hypothetical protein
MDIYLINKLFYIPREAFADKSTRIMNHVVGFIDE